MSHLSSLYQLTKNQSNRYEPYLPLAQENGCEGMYQYKIIKMNSKYVIPVFLLCFFLLYII